jgi:Uma2 family endonuclease
MVMLAPDVTATTIEEFFALPEDISGHEFLRGKHFVVTPSPARLHQMVAARLTLPLGNFLVRHPTLTMFFAPADVRIEEHSVVQPDIFVVRGEFPAKVDAQSGLEIPELVIEILSPGTAGRDRGEKREIYQKTGVAEYWIADIDSRVIERWRPEDERPEILRESITWQPDEGGEV